MDHRINASYETLMEQSTSTAAYYLTAAVRYVDGVLGHGASLRKPELVIAFMEACAKDYRCAVDLIISQGQGN